MHQLVIQFRVEGMEDYDGVVALEDLLIERLDDGSDVDGHDAGGGAMNVFIYTEDDPATFGEFRGLIAGHPFASAMAAGYREDDEDADELLALWPEGSTGFEVL